MWVGDVPDEPPSRPLYAVISPRGLPLPAPRQGFAFWKLAISTFRLPLVLSTLALMAEAKAELESLLPQRADRPLGQLHILSTGVFAFE
jgi:hypothetical protein